MANYKFVVSMPHLTGLPEDVTINTFSFESTNIAVDFVNIAQDLVDLYNDPTGQTQSVATYFAHILDRGAGACTIEAYNRATPGDPPVDSITWTMDAAAAANSGPTQVALVLSFHADFTGAGTQRARRRGRVFMGPFQETLNTTSSGNVQPDQQLVDDLATAGDRLLGASGLAPYDWQVWSTVDNVGRDVVGGWVDNRWDTQRRRIAAATSRVSFP